LTTRSTAFVGIALVVPLLLAAVLALCPAATAAATPVAATPVAAASLLGPPAFRETLSGLSAEQQAKLSVSEGADNDSFGDSVAISGDTAVVGADWDDVGATRDQGSAYVFVRSGATWTRQATLNAADGASWMCFGSSVAISGDTIVVGALYATVGSNTEQGAVYVFTRSGTTWSQQAKLTADDGDDYDWFGRAVAMSGETVVIGAMGDDVGANVDQGCAYVFTRSGGVWSRQAKIAATDGAGGDLFGGSVAISGDAAVVGAQRDDIATAADQGSAYVFTRTAAAWSQTQKLMAADGAAEDWFGCAVALAGDTAVIGAVIDDIGTSTDQGSACVFVRNGDVWGQQQKLVASGGDVDDQFGCSVAIAANVAVVGARYDDVGGHTHQGSASVFVRSGTTWSQQAELVAADGATSRSLGWSVATSNGTAAVGAPQDGYGSKGAAYIFVGEALEPADTTPPSTTDNSDTRSHAAFNLILTPTDGDSGVATTQYRINGGEWQTGTSVWLSFAIRHKRGGVHKGVYVVEYFSTDTAGNVEATKGCQVRLGV
jgi:hypothetical protein